MSGADTDWPFHQFPSLERNPLLFAGSDGTEERTSIAGVEKVATAVESPFHQFVTVDHNPPLVEAGSEGMSGSIIATGADTVADDPLSPYHQDFAEKTALLTDEVTESQVLDQVGSSETVGELQPRRLRKRAEITCTSSIPASEGVDKMTSGYSSLLSLVSGESMLTQNGGRSRELQSVSMSGGARKSL